MEDFKKEACKIALNKLFKDTTFSICTIDSLLKLTNTIPDPEVYKVLHVLHCASYADMSAGFRKELFGMVLGMFKTNGFEFEDIEKMYESNIIEMATDDIKEKSFFKKLIGA